MNKKIIVVLVSGLICLGIVYNSHNYAESDEGIAPYIMVQLVGTSPIANRTFTVNIDVNSNNTNLSVISVDLTYNSTVFAITNVTELSVFGLTSINEPNSTVGPGSLHYSISTINNSSAPINGTYLIVNFSLQYFDEDVTNFSFNITNFGFYNETFVSLTNVTEYNMSLEVTTPSDYYDLDVYPDGLINVMDLISILNWYNETGIPGWVVEDVNYDGIIDIKDFNLVNMSRS